MQEHIWTEKYRPKQFSDIKGQESIVQTVQGFVQTKNLPHLLFTGPAGVGKTSLAGVIARELYGELYKDNILELNASDERGIDVVRNTIKDFARTKSVHNAPFKIIYLDEADALTREAQQALRRTMENYTNSCRFILSCNYASKIIDPIQSRCAVFKFKPLSKEAIFKLIEDIAAKEGLSIDETTKDALYTVSGGDVRRLQNLLQAAHATKNVHKEAIYHLASIAQPQELKEVLLRAHNGDFIGSRDLLLKTMLEYGMSGNDIVKQLQSITWKLDEVSNQKKLTLTRACGECEFRIVEGADPYIQLEALLATFMTE